LLVGARRLKGGVVIGLSTHQVSSVAVIGAHCADIAIGVGGTLLEITRHRPDIVVHALVLTGGGTASEVEERNAFAALCGDAEVRLTVANLPDGQLARYPEALTRRLAAFRRGCEPDLMIGPQCDDSQQDRRVVAEILRAEFCDHLILGYEILEWESDLPHTTIYRPLPVETAIRKAEVFDECYPSKPGPDRFDGEAFTALMRLRGAQCQTQYAEGFLVDTDIVDIGAA
jgi:LmbE family N-acetylglucosaminyl deacetylase